ncbi:putative Cas4-like protein [Proteus phage P16-2532]|nr:exonuclease [Proteus phage ASh-2020a]QHJ72796.1 putative Cas4-like protein [Proteus phage P16-2532]
MDKSFLHRLMLACENDGHSIFAPSYSATWMNCPGSLIPSILEEDSAGFEAAEGTVAHAIAEEWLRTGNRPDHLLNTIQIHEENGNRFEIPVDNEMFEYLQEYIKMCGENKGDQFVETKVWFTDLMPIANPDADELNGEDESPIKFIRQGGTCDHAVCQPGKLIITDLKYGQFIHVSTDDNTQLKLYAYGFFREFDEKYHFEDIEIRICQPRKYNFGRFKMTRAEIIAFGERVKKATKEAWSMNALRYPSEKACEWCKISYKCPANFARILDIKNGRYSPNPFGYSADDMASIKDLLREELNLQLKETSLLTWEEISLIYPHRKPIEKWFKDVEKAASKRIMDGKPIKGLKMVAKRGTRQFVEESTATEELEFVGLDESQINPTKMISPKQAETLLKKLGYDKEVVKSILSDLTFTKPGEPTLVTEDDPRKDLNEKYQEVWDD